MIDQHHERRGRQHLRIAVHREEGQRSEDVEVGLDAAAGEMDQEGADGHLADRDDMTGQWPPGRGVGQVGGQHADQSADHDRDPDVGMDRRLVARPREGRDGKRQHDGEDPLRQQQEREHAIGLDAEALVVVGDEGLDPDIGRGDHVAVGRGEHRRSRRAHDAPSWAARAQPKTLKVATPAGRVPAAQARR